MKIRHPQRMSGHQPDTGQG